MDEEVIAGAEGEVVETPAEETEEVAAPAEEAAPAGEDEVA